MRDTNSPLHAQEKRLRLLIAVCDPDSVLPDVLAMQFNFDANPPNAVKAEVAHLFTEFTKNLTVPMCTILNISP